MTKYEFRTIRGKGPARSRHLQTVDGGRTTGVIVHQSGTTYWVTGPVESPPHRFSTFRAASRCAAALHQAYDTRINR